MSSIDFHKKWIGLHFGRLFHKRIRSPWQWQPTFAPFFSLCKSSQSVYVGLSKKRNGDRGEADGQITLYDGTHQGCQIVFFQTKNPNLGKFWRALEWKGLVYGHTEYFTAIWYILWPFGNVVIIWYIFLGLGILCQGKSGNPGIQWQDSHVGSRFLIEAAVGRVTTAIIWRQKSVAN
jgi:hypothetical protein